jgi:predicted transcriptional regulator
MLTKVKLREQVERLPDEFSIDELIEKLILIEKIENGMEQSEKGEVISDDEMEKEIEKWFE